jgi:nucleotide-binding universal stress UspA family protein
LQEEKASIQIKRILVPVDGSKPSEKATEFGIALAKLLNADVIALHVIQTAPYTTVLAHPSTVPPPIPLVDDEVRKFANECVNKVAEKAKGFDVKVIPIISETSSSVRDEIIKIAKEKDVDLIVMGTRGMTGLKRIILGSVASGVVTYAPCPVLVVRPKETSEEEKVIE